jgi:hypothetical protein
MKKVLLVFSLLVALAAPVMASPRDDDPRGGEGVVKRIVFLLKRLVSHALGDEIQIGPPKP